MSAPRTDPGAPMLRQGLPERQFSDAAALLAHYRALQTRLWNPPAPRPRPKTVRTIDLAEIQRQRLAREADARHRAVLAERAELQALVFQVLDPERVAREPRRIIVRVALAFGFAHADIVGPGRTVPVIRARYAAIASVHAARTDLSSKQLGRIFRRDHTTILHALRRNAERGVPQPPVERGA